MIADVSLVPQSVLDQWSPIVYGADLWEYARENTIRKNLCNSDFAGEIKGYGSKLVIRKKPAVQTHKFVANAPFIPQKLTADSIEVTVGRGRTWAVTISEWEEMTSDIKGWQSIVTQEGGKQLDEDEEIEFFQSIAAFGNPENQGHGAGLRNGIYELGTADLPLLVTRADADFVAAGDTSVADPVVGSQGAALLLCDIDAMMSEQPGFGQQQPFAVIPPAFANLVRKSEHFSRLTHAETDGWALRKGLKAIGMIGGLTLYQSNLLYTFKQAGGRRTVFDIVFGDKRAITYADIVSRIDVKVPQDVIGIKHIVATHVYDWFCPRPEYLGHALVTIGAAA